MAYPVSLQTLIQRVRQRATLEGAQAFVTDIEITDHVNQSLAVWYDEVRGTTWNGSHFRSAFIFQTKPSNLSIPNPITNPPPGSVYALPADFVSVISVDVYISAQLIISARAFQEEQRNMFRWYPVGWLFGEPIFYQIQCFTSGGVPQIVFIPAPQAAFQVQVNYVPTAPQLMQLNQTFDSINGWEEFIVLDAAIKCLIKDGQLDIIPLLQSRMEMERERIRAMAPRRDMQSAEVVHEIANYDTDWLVF